MSERPNIPDWYYTHPGEHYFTWEDGIGSFRVFTRQGKTNARRERMAKNAREFNRIKRGLPRGR